MSAECESVRGEWGGICPDCGQRLPARVSGPPSSKIEKPAEWAFGTVTGRRWTEQQRESVRATWERKRADLTDRESEVLRIVAKHNGNRNAAARELGISSPVVFATLKRLRGRGIEVPAAYQRTEVPA